MIKKLLINNFRNYDNISIDLYDDDNNSNIIVLYGENGEGKTNILEGISLFSSTKGLRKSKYDDIINKKHLNIKNYWNIILETDEDIFSSGYIKQTNKSKRIYKVNDKLTRDIHEFSKDNYIVWMTYETDRLFLDSPSKRRDFIDMFCSALYYTNQKSIHSENIYNYEKLTRERMKILKKYCEKNKIGEDISRWLDIIEEKIAILGIKIANQRIKITQILEENQLKENEFLEFKNEMTGPLENSTILDDIDNQLEKYKIELKDRRQKDGFSGSTTFGPNRSDWKLFYEEKNIYAEFASAGEQKMLLSSAFLSFIVNNIKSDSRNLILLLDDVIAHLDLKHRNLFFKYIKDIVSKNLDRVTVWLSGTSKELFNELDKEALFFKVSNNIVEKG